MASAWLLASRYRVTLIDKNDYIGGHTHTIDVLGNGNSRSVPVDTGFIVYNTPNYPHLVGLFDTLGVATRPTDMSFSASIAGSGLEYAGSNLDTVFAQRRNLLSPRFIRMLRDILRFNSAAKKLLAEPKPDAAEMTLGAFLDQHRLGAALRDDYLLPMAAAIWSCPPRQMLAFPARSFARFFYNHGLLNLNDRPQWRTVVGGSRAYVTRLLADFSGTVITNDAVSAVFRRPTSVLVKLSGGGEIIADKLVVATHADEALALLDEPGDSERSLLGAFGYQHNDTYLHTDTALMPALRKVWSCWNYLARHDDAATAAVSVTYWMNALQGIPGDTNYFVSLNPITPPDEASILRRISYAHPVFDSRAMQAQQSLHRLQGHLNTWFAGSYFGYGFHEDALRSAVEVAQQLGVKAPWQTVTAA